MTGNGTTVYFWILLDGPPLFSPKENTLAAKFKTNCADPLSALILTEVARFSPTSKLIKRNNDKDSLTHELGKILQKSSEREFWSIAKEIACSQYNDSKPLLPFVEDQVTGLCFTFGSPVRKENGISTLPTTAKYVDEKKAFQNRKNKKVHGEVSFKIDVDCKRRTVQSIAPFELKDIKANKKYLLSSAEENFISNALVAKRNAKRIASLICDDFTFVIGTRR